MARRTPILLAAIAASTMLAACGGGNSGSSVKDADPVIEHGAKLFAERCSGCHTLDSVGSDGSADKINDRERIDGPNFNVRKECYANVLYAIQNGGYSGAIMPENIAVGNDAIAIAKFLAKYSGKDSKVAPGSSPVSCTTHP